MTGIFRLAMATALCAVGLQGALTVSLGGAPGVCREVKLPMWTVPVFPTHSYPWQSVLSHSPLESDWDFRSSDDGVLVGVFAIPDFVSELKHGPVVYSPTKYAIDLTNGKIRKVTEAEWARAMRYFPVRDQTKEAESLSQSTDKLTRNGKVYARRGELPIDLFSRARLSPDGSFFAAYGWDGDTHGRSLNDVAPPVGVNGHVYVDVYDTSSQAIVFSITGRWKGVESNPDKLFHVSAWYSSRFYVFPIDDYRMNRFIICDMATLHGQDR